MTKGCGFHLSLHLCCFSTGPMGGPRSLSETEAIDGSRSFHVSTAFHLTFLVLKCDLAGPMGSGPKFHPYKIPLTRDLP